MINGLESLPAPIEEAGWKTVAVTNKPLALIKFFTNDHDQTLIKNVITYSQNVIKYGKAFYVYDT